MPFLDAGRRTQEGHFARLAQLLKHVFEPAVVGDGLPKGFDPSDRERQSNSFALHFAHPGATAGRVGLQAALRGPTQLGNFGLQAAIALLKPTQFGGGNTGSAKKREANLSLFPFRTAADRTRLL